MKCLKKILQKIFGKKLIHIHEYITKLDYYTYCKICGSPFSCLEEAKTIMQSKRKTRRLNVLLNKRKYFGKGIRVKSRTNHTPLPEPPGLTKDEEHEYQLLLVEQQARLK